MTKGERSTGRPRRTVAARPRGARPARPTPAAWFAAALEGAGLPRPVVSGQGSGLRIWFALGTESLEVDLTPLGSEEPCFAETARFTVRYRGGPDLGPDARRLLERFVELLRRLEPKLPKHLERLATPAEEDPRGWLALEAAFPFCAVEQWTSPQGPRHELLVRVTAACNQRCPFCSAPLLADEPSTTALGDCLDQAARRLSGAQLTITGGEPLLRTDWFPLVSRALAADAFSRVSIQTNAVLASRAESIPAHPRLGFFVSLHGATDATYDRCTATTGQLSAAIAGIRLLQARGHTVSLNAVVCRENVAELNDLVRVTADLAAEGPIDQLHFSILMCPEHRPGAADHLVPYAQAVPRLVDAWKLARSLGIRVPRLVSSHAALPPCQVPPAHRPPAGEHPRLRPGETGLPEENAPWVKAPQCARCAATTGCLGVPRPYFLRFGLAELRPIRPLRGP